MQGVGNEFDERSSETEIEERQILCYGPRKSEEPEARGTKVQSRDRHDEERERERYRQSEKIEQRVVGDA